MEQINWIQRCVPCVWFVALSALIVGYAHAENVPGELAMHTSEWDRQVLEYEASKLFITVRTRIELERQSRDKINENLMPVPGDGGERVRQPVSEMGTVLTILSQFMGRSSEVKAWMDLDGQILQLSSHETGHRNRYRRYRYLDDFVYSIKRFPETKGEEPLSWREWTRIQEDRYPLPDAFHSRWLAEPESLLYLVPTIDWEALSGELVLPLFDTDGIMPIRMQPERQERIKVSYELIEGGRKSTVSDRVDTLVIRADVADEPGDGDHNFSFLGYKGGVDIYLDPKTRRVVQIRGQVDYLGEVVIRLKSATLGSMP